MQMTVLNISFPLARVSAGTPGGAEQVLAALDRELVHHGHRSLVLAPSGSQCLGRLFELHSYSQVLDDNAKRQSHRRCRAAIKHIIASSPVDIIHFHGLDFYSYLPDGDIPAVVTLHLPPAWYPPEVFRFHRDHLHLVCVSKSQARCCPAGAEIEAVIPNGIHLEDFRPTSRKGKYALCLGRICPEKGFHLALDACTAAHMPLFIAGAVFPYPEHEQYFRESILPRLKNGHRYLGTVGGQRKHDLIAGAQCLIVSSLVEETSSLVAMEAAACGVPVVAFAHGALPEVVRHGRTGFVVENVEQMISALGSVHRIDSAECRKEATGSFKDRRMAAAYIALYSQLLERRRNPMDMQEGLRCA